jgi:hypothetical protein
LQCIVLPAPREGIRRSVERLVLLLVVVAGLQARVPPVLLVAAVGLVVALEFFPAPVAPQDRVVSRRGLSSGPWVLTRASGQEVTASLLHHWCLGSLACGMTWRCTPGPDHCGWFWYGQFSPRDWRRLQRRLRFPLAVGSSAAAR